MNPAPRSTPNRSSASGLADPEKGGVKILGRGELTKKLIVKTSAISSGARAKIEAAGGTVELIPNIAKKPAGKKTVKQEG